MKYNNLFELRGKATIVQKTTLAIIGYIIILAIWQIASIIVNKNGILPSPLLPITVAFGGLKGSVLTSIPQLLKDDFLIKNILYSVGLNLMGYLIAIVISIPIGYIMGLSTVIKELFNKPINALRFLPLTAVTGLFIAWFGLESSMKIYFLALGIIVYLIPVIVQRISEVDDTYVQTVKTLGASKFQEITKVYIPAAMSKISDDIRVLTAISWTYIIVAELLVNEGGIGALTFRAARQGRLDKVFMILFIIIAIGVIQDRIFLWIDKTMFKYKYIQQGK